MEPRDSTEQRQYLSFTLGGIDYAVPILRVKEILQYETVTRIPSVPRSVRGVINLRGAVVPVMDLIVKLGMPESAVTRRTCILIVEAAMGGERTVMGVLADSVREVLELAQEDIEPPPSFGVAVRVEFLLGMGKAGKGFVLLLDLDRILSAGDVELAQRLTMPEATEAGPQPALDVGTATIESGEAAST